jgi:hypothetical protein
MHIRSKILGLTAAAALAGGLAIAGGGQAGGQTTGSQTFAFPGREQTFQVPDGVTAIAVDASGPREARRPIRRAGAAAAVGPAAMAPGRWTRSRSRPVRSCS